MYSREGEEAKLGAKRSKENLSKDSNFFVLLERYLTAIYWPLSGSCRSIGLPQKMLVAPQSLLAQSGRNSLSDSRRDIMGAAQHGEKRKVEKSHCM